MTRGLAEWIAYLCVLPLFLYSCLIITRMAWTNRKNKRPRVLVLLILAQLGLTASYIIFTLAAILRWSHGGMLDLNIAFILRIIGVGLLIPAQLGFLQWFFPNEKSPTDQKIR